MRLARRSREKNEATPDPEGHMTFLEHLAELRRRIIVSAVAVGIGGAICFALFVPILDLLSGPYCDIRPAQECAFLQTDPLEAFSARLNVALYGGLALAMPVLLFQLWRFVTPALHPNEKRFAIPFVLAGAVLFLLGAGLAFYTVPRALEFLVEIGGDQFEAFFTGSSYLSFLVKMMVAFGIGFEFPILLVFLQLAQVVQPRQLSRYRRHALVGIVAGVAVITPSGDPFSLAVLSIPMYLFYEGSILIGRILRR